MTRILRSCSSLLGAVRSDAVTTLLPADCSICAGPLTAWASAPVCEPCIKRVEPQSGLLCLICGEALDLESSRFAMAMGVDTCSACRLAPPPFRRAVAYAEYIGELREMIHLLKYEGVRDLASTPLGVWLAQAMLQVKPETGCQPLVIAVPLFRARRNERGFNHSEALAHAAVRHLRKPHPEWKLCEAHDVLIRRKDTQAQFLLTRKGRRRNLEAAFAVTRPEKIAGREVILIDDILTTGATARECSRVLLRAGASAVRVVTLARAQAERSVLHNPQSSDTALWTMPPPTQLPN